MSYKKVRINDGTNSFSVRIRSEYDGNQHEKDSIGDMETGQSSPELEPHSQLNQPALDS